MANDVRRLQKPILASVPVSGPLLSDDAGFTLVEVMVSSALMIVSLLAASYSFVSQKTLSKSQDIQSQAKQTLDQIVAKIQSNPNQFPLLLDSTNSYALTYVACFADDGTALQTYNQAATDTTFNPGSKGHKSGNQGGGPTLTTTPGSPPGFVTVANGNSESFSQPMFLSDGNQACLQDTGVGQTPVQGSNPNLTSVKHIDQYAGIEVHVVRDVNLNNSQSNINSLKVHAMILNTGRVGASGVLNGGTLIVGTSHLETVVNTGIDTPYGTQINRNIVAPSLISFN